MELQDFLDIAPDPLVVIDEDGLIVHVNHQAELLFGYSRIELVDHPIEMLVPADFHAAHRRHRQRYVANPVVRHMGAGLELAARRKDGVEVPVEISLSPVSTSEGGRVIAAVRDITERKRVEQLRCQLAAIVESSMDAILSMRIDGTITSWNAGAERLYGHTAEEIKGQSYGILLPPERSGELALVLGRLSRGEGIQQLDTVRRAKSGELIEVSTTFSPMLDGFGRVRGATTIGRDLTERRALERLQREFFAMAAHELKTPVSTIKLLTSGLEDYGDDLDVAAIQVLLRSVENESDRLDRIISTLLDLARFDARAFRLEKRPCTIARILDGLGPELSALTRGHELRIELPPTLPEVLADDDQLGRVLTNLIGNASKYSPPGTLIKVKAAMGLLGDELIVSVVDQGFGIAPDELNQVFDRFYRGPTGSRRAAGTGLGLALTKAVVEAHGGRIWAESELGKGSVFRFSLPATRSATQAAPV